ncbi:Ent-kaurene oxidase [Madurella mycetomatis]|uniref:Ent-kaurene oxidase n=1 Tax=Madurella mycetomatis TaxID=100816 RepID=A0A175WBZ5_9PEZI|nr:Ent-kaurene oxidase [Madurella mycetomatis]
MSTNLLPLWVTSRPLPVGGIALLCILVAAANAILVDFLETFLKRPRHFSKEPWWKSLLSKKPRANVPVIEYPDRAYKIRHFPDEIVIVPHNFIEVIKNTPESKLSFQQASYDFFLGKLTGITGHEHEMSALIRRDIARLLDRVYDTVEDEAKRAVAAQIGPCEDWTPIVLLPRVVQMIINISQRVFVGEPLCRDERWVQCITQCTAGAFQSVPKLWPYHWLMRPFVAWRLSELRSVRKHRIEAKKLLKPILEKRLEDMKSEKFEPPADLIQLVIDGTKGQGRNLDYQVNAQIGTGRAALFTTGVTVTHLLYDLATRPKYIEPLRQEVLELGPVKMNRANVAKLKKMDSFIRECQRWNKFMLVGTIRKVLKPMTLPDGTQLPVGTLLGMDTQNAIFNHSTLEKPDVFDGFRFERLRSVPGSEQKFQAVNPGPDHLVYGYGTQACPGRFFAVHEAKVVLARILTKYDFKLAKPAESPMSRAKGILTEADATVEFLFKARKDN